MASSVTTRPPDHEHHAADLEELAALIEEARRRTRRRRRWYGAAALFAAAAVAVAFFGFGHGGGGGSGNDEGGNLEPRPPSAPRAPNTELTIFIANEKWGVALFRLACTPPRGDVPTPARACSALRRRPQIATRPTPRPISRAQKRRGIVVIDCFGGPYHQWEVTVSGTLRGRPVHAKTGICWPSKMELIGVLGIPPGCLHARIWSMPCPRTRA